MGHHAPMSDDLRSELEARSGPVQWRDLQAHVLREAMFLVDPKLSLLDVAVAIAEDDEPKVSAWIEGGQLTRPSKEQLETWEHVPDKPFLAVPVQPFALAQELPDEG